MIIAADIGGTKARFASFHLKNGKLTLFFQKQYQSRNFLNLEEAIQTFIIDFSQAYKSEKIEIACISLAGPVINGECTLVNLGWVCRTKDLKKIFPNIPIIKLCNDLEATGYGISILPDDDFLCFTQEIPKKKANELRHSDKNHAILAPGTGLGEALIMGGRVFPTEGAHCEFGPRTMEEAGLWKFLHQKYKHVSYERILSGPGIVNLAKFLMEEKEISDLGFTLIPEEITGRAMAGTCDICKNALDLFISILGAEAGNLALKSLSMGGVFLGGGIPPKILPKLQEEIFRNAFNDKGRFHNLMTNIPVFIILNSQAALFGAALIAAQQVCPDKDVSLA